MAKLTDLPAELVHRIIDHLIQLHRSTPYGQRRHNPQADYDAPRRPRPHLEDRHTDGSSSLHSPRRYATRQADIDKAELSWPDGIPNNLLLPLALVSRTFRGCAQQKLFSNVALVTPWQAYVFSQALTGPSPMDESQDASEQGQSGANPPRPSHLAHYVHSLQFLFRGTGSMGLGGGALICEIVESCPHLEHLAMNSRLLMRCKDPITRALASRPRIKELVLLENANRAPLEACWLADELVAHLFSKWHGLQTLELRQLSGRPPESIESIHQALPVLECRLREIILLEPDLDQRELALLLNSSRETIRTLQIVEPSAKLDRPGLCRILKEHTGPNLESLTLTVGDSWHPISTHQRVKGSDDPSKTNGLLEIVFRSSSALRKLKHLSVVGRISNSDLFKLLPQSLVQLDWDGFLGPLAFTDALSSWRVVDDVQYPPRPCSPPSGPTFDDEGRERWLPNLECSSVVNDNKWLWEDRMAIEDAMKAAHGVDFIESSNSLRHGDHNTPQDLT
ncbi:hypothetical protein PtB15_5B76 [Puccinia triticina]|nr:hypothetical protein PtB15_5B76 [Puccinia triticina]